MLLCGIKIKAGNVLTSWATISCSRM